MKESQYNSQIHKFNKDKPSKKPLAHNVRGIYNNVCKKLTSFVPPSSQLAHRDLVLSSTKILLNK